DPDHRGRGRRSGARHRLREGDASTRRQRLRDRAATRARGAAHHAGRRDDGGGGRKDGTTEGGCKESSAATGGTRSVRGPRGHRAAAGPADVARGGGAASASGAPLL